MSVQQALMPKTPVRYTRRLPIGAELVGHGGGVHFRVWAPKCRSVEVAFDDGAHVVALERQDDGHFSGLAPQARVGTHYAFRLDGSDTPYPDPASRFQPRGVHGPCEVIDPLTFRWTDGNWKGTGAEGQVVYEMHVGTFTPQGTWAAATEKLPHLADVGVTCLEVMPVCDFAGKFGWGYDGVDFFAPTRLYGRPDDFRAFVDRAHALGIGVILDVVYNHFGPDGNYLCAFADDYTSQNHKTDWGGAVNFDGPDSGPVREFFLTNIRYWLEEFHLDGFRFDATQAIVDDSPDEHILAAISRTAREMGRAMGKQVYLVNENEPQHTRLVRKGADGHGMDALWNDDFHHSAMVALTGRHEAYYSDHRGTAQEFVSAAKWGYLFQGQRYSWQGKRRGTPAFDLPPTAFVNFIQNHDQIANSGRGYRSHQVTSSSEYKAITALTLLMPQTPMLFQGQEWAASSTFHYFADHTPELANMVCAGRAKELSQFPSVASPEMQACLLDPGDISVFERSKLKWDEVDRTPHRWYLQMHKDLLALRRSDDTFRRVQKRGDVDGAVLGPGAFVLRYFGSTPDQDRLLVVNLGRDLDLSVAPEPLLAPVSDMRWRILWSSEDPAYGGCGTAPLDTEAEGWLLPGRSAVVLRPVPLDQGAKSRVRKAGDDEGEA